MGCRTRWMGLGLLLVGCSDSGRESSAALKADAGAVLYVDKKHGNVRHIEDFRACSEIARILGSDYSSFCDGTLSGTRQGERSKEELRECAERYRLTVAVQKVCALLARVPENRHEWTASHLSAARECEESFAAGLVDAGR